MAWRRKLICLEALIACAIGLASGLINSDEDGANHLLRREVIDETVARVLETVRPNATVTKKKVQVDATSNKTESKVESEVDKADANKAPQNNQSETKKEIKQASLSASSATLSSSEAANLAKAGPSWSTGLHDSTNLQQRVGTAASNTGSLLRREDQSAAFTPDGTMVQLQQERPQTERRVTQPAPGPAAGLAQAGVAPGLQALKETLGSAALRPAPGLKDTISPPDKPDMKALKCGFDVDCPLDYSLALVNKTSASSQASMETNRRALEKVHDVARQACATAGNTDAAILPHGGWCYGTKTAKHPPPMQKNDMDYLVPAHHVSVDEVIANTLAERVLLKKDGSCCYSLTDLGAGVGQLGHALRARLPKLDYYGYDGAGNVEEFTSNYVRFADLTIPLSLKQTDWVVSTEVGEHIPHEYEAQVIANIHAHNCKGIILTWAVLKQSGNGHVNCHSNQYLIKAFEELGYKFNEDLAAALRVHRQMNRWFEHSSMVFERITKPAACAE